MFVHTVYFWLRRDLDAAQLQCFSAGLESLKTIPSTGGSFTGRPASTARPVIDRTYDFALTCLFKDQAEHDVYQVHPTHLAFLENCRDLWIRVLVYDAE
jgi:Stress responsive A/B Barrel Domain